MTLYCVGVYPLCLCIQKLSILARLPFYISTSIKTKISLYIITRSLV